MHVLLTGCSSGIGLAICERLIEQGYTVTGLSRREPPIESNLFSWVPADLGELNASTLSSVKQGAYNAFVHAAGVMYTGPLEAYDEPLATQMWRLHVAAPSQLMKHLMVAQHPLTRVVLIGSRTQQGATRKSAYAASKAAQQGLVRSWAMELMSSGTTVNLVAPGATKTPMLDDPARAGVAPKLPPMGRFIEPNEIAGTVAFLLSDDACSLTGQTLTVCAGASL